VVVSGFLRVRNHRGETSDDYEYRTEKISM
jgi:hypothetical protein